MGRELNSDLYVHESDKAAMDALKAIPGFSQLMKAFMKVWNEQQFKIQNMSTNLKLGKGQMEKYYNMLPPICEKLGIEIPELYVKLDVRPNAYTYGDTKPFIVLTSGLFETMPDELIATVIAHECGHIACHHTLYTTMGRILLNGTYAFLNGLANVAIYPIQLAFAYWMRCSEFSADRAAVICDGGSEKSVEMCMRFAGWNKNIAADADVELFMEQAKDYREMVKENAWNKTLEFFMFQYNDHPLNAVRAYESREWGQSARFRDILEYLNSSDEEREEKKPFRMNWSLYKGKDAEEVRQELRDKGFYQLTMERVTEADAWVDNGEVLSICVDGKENPGESYYSLNAEIVIRYYEPKTNEEIAIEHQGEIVLEEGAKSFINRNYEEVRKELEELGFFKIETVQMAMPTLSFGLKADNVARIMIDGQTVFEKKCWFRPDAEIILYYYTN